jgi:hypothetical protein
MASLGDLGVVKPKVSDSFGWFGAEVRVHPFLTDIVLMDFAEEAQHIDENSPEVMGFIKKQMRLVIEPDDFDVFWKAALENGQDSADLMAVMKTIVETKAQRPTLLPADSSAGQARIVTTSPDVSSLPATADSPLAAADRDVFQETLVETRAKLLQFRDAAYPDLTPIERRVIEAEAGRPDVVQMVLETARQRATG